MILKYIFIIILQLVVYNKGILLNYQAIYDSICYRGQVRTLPPGTYVEKHHIVPKCLNGSNQKENITRLTAREHFLCHYILAIKLYPDNHKLMYALWAMCKLENKYQNRNISSKTYEQTRIIYSKFQSERVKGKGNPRYGKLVTQETHEKLKEKRKLRVGIYAPNYGKSFSKEWREKMSIKKAGEKNPFSGKRHSNATIEILREKAQSRPATNCRKLIDDCDIVYNSRKEYMNITKTSEAKMYKLFKLGVLKSI